MTGSSSTWYAISARCSVSRNSAARAAGSEDGKQLFRGVDDRVRRLALEPFALVDPAPRNGDREHAGRLRCAHVEGGVADIRRLARLGVHPPRAQEEGVRVRLVLDRLVA